MSGIKQIYRSVDAFRLPTYDAAISYPVNSVVAHYDSDSGNWYHYISNTQTNPGSLDSEIADLEWARFTFDSEMMLDAVNAAVLANSTTLTNSLATVFSAELARLDSENDSDFAAMTLAVTSMLDSDLLSLKNYVDSELLIFSNKVDSDTLYLKTLVNDSVTYMSNIVDCRIYDSEKTASGEVLTALEQAFQRSSTEVAYHYMDPNQPDEHLHLELSTSSSKNSDQGLIKHEVGSHTVANLLDSETIYGYFDYEAHNGLTGPSAYIGGIAFRGTTDAVGGGFFRNAQIVWYYVDSDSELVQDIGAVTDNNTDVILLNPKPEKQVVSFRLTAWHKNSNDFTGINFIKLGSTVPGNLVQGQKICVIRFDHTYEMVAIKPYDDTAAFVRSTNTYFISKDSEWVCTDAKYSYVDTTISNLNSNFPPSNLADGVKAYVTQSNDEYYVKDGVWLIEIPEHNQNLDSDLRTVDHDRAALDSDFNLFLTSYNQHIIDYNQQVEAFDDRIEQNDSEIIRLSAALSTFYTDNVRIKQSNAHTVNQVDSDLGVFDTRITNLANLLSQTQYNTVDSDYVNQIIQIHQNDYLTFTTAVSNYISALREDHDSDYEVTLQSVLANAIDTSSLRNTEVAQNTTNINNLQIQVSNNDSDILALANRDSYYTDIFDTLFGNDSDQNVRITNAYTLNHNAIETEKNERKTADSDLSDRVSELSSSVDSEILERKFQDVRLADIDSELAARQWPIENQSTLEIANYALQINPFVDIDITSLVLGDYTPVPYSYPEIKFFFSTTGVNASTTLAGAICNGHHNTPALNYTVTHDVTGAITSITFRSNVYLINDLAIVSNFRIR